MTSTEKAKLTGERPQQGVTPDSLLALHAAGYQAVIDRLGPGRLLDVGCGQGFESVGLIGQDRRVIGVDYSAEATDTALARFGSEGLGVAQMNALQLGFGRWVVRCRVQFTPDRAFHRASRPRGRDRPCPL